MNPGKLDRRVLLQYSSATRDAMGGEVIAWTDAVTVWAGKVPLTGGRQFAAEGKQYAASLQYIIRHRTDVKAGWRLTHGDDVFEITFVDPGEGRNSQLTLSVRSVDQSIGYADRDTSDDILVTDQGDTLVASSGEQFAADQN